MEIISVTAENIEDEHICCAITEKKGETCVAAKKAWMADRFSDGLAFRKLDVRGKVFIEYIPAEKAWCPIEADGYMHIDCFWVSGQYKGKGYANELLAACIADAKKQGKLGVTVLSSAKKMPFLSDPKFLKHKGFKVDRYGRSPVQDGAPVDMPFRCERSRPCFQKPGQAPSHPRCRTSALLYRSMPICGKVRAYRSAEWLRSAACRFALHKIDSLEKAKAAPAACTAYALFRDGEFITNEILSEKKLTELFAN